MWELANISFIRECFSQCYQYLTFQMYQTHWKFTLNYKFMEKCDIMHQSIFDIYFSIFVVLELGHKFCFMKIFVLHFLWAHKTWQKHNSRILCIYNSKTKNYKKNKHRNILPWYFMFQVRKLISSFPLRCIIIIIHKWSVLPYFPKISIF